MLKILNEIGTVENIPEFIEGVKNRYFVLYLVVHQLPKRLHIETIIYHLFPVLTSGSERCQVLGIVCTKTMIPEQRS